MERRHGSVRAALIVIALIALAAPAARAETYPSRPVRLVLPFGAGGVADISARVVADKLGDQLGQRFIVDNQPGAGGIAAARTALSAPRDGYTLSLLTNATAISVPLFNNLPFDPLKDFTPISTLGYFDCLFVTNAASEFRSLPDFLRIARAKPGALNVGTVNPGSTQHLTAELFKSTAGVDFVIVPFRTTPEAVLALLRGDIQMVIDFYAGLKPGLVDGKTRAIAWSASTRSPALPDVPTVQEGGVAGFNVTFLERPLRAGRRSPGGRRDDQPEPARRTGRPRREAPAARSWHQLQSQYAGGARRADAGRYQEVGRRDRARRNR